MSEPVTTLITYFSISRIWGIIAGICGSVIPLMALSDKTKIEPKRGVFIGLCGASFAIFIGPEVVNYLNVTSLEGISALSWFMGATGIYVIRAVLSWIDEKGPNILDALFSKLTGVDVKNDTDNSK